MMIVYFEDHGQDFLEWLIDDETGKVLDCKPYQARIWVGKYVFCPRSLSQENCTQVVYSDLPVTHFSQKLTAIKYPIKSIRHLNPIR